MTLREWLARLDERQARFEARAARMESDLAEHIRRTELLEKHVTAWVIIGRFIAGAVVIAGVIVGIVVGLVGLLKG